MDRGADYPIDAVGRGRLNRKLATSCLEEHSELIRARSDARHLISQPRFEPRGVSDGRFPESKQGPDLGPMTLPGPTCRIVLAVMVGSTPSCRATRAKASASISIALLGNRPYAR
jgi:hypothetical protein